MTRPKIKIILLGSNGQVGHALRKLASHIQDEFELTFLERNDIDLNSIESIQHLNQMTFDVLINAAAYTAVDLAEQESELCFSINSRALKELATICLKKSALLIHFSTDYVYNNDLRRPLLETDPTLPKNVYAISKLQGEEAIRSILDRHIIIRTSWVYSEDGHNFVKTMLKLAASSKELSLVNDQTGSPTYASDLAFATILLLKQNLIEPENKNLLGTFNFSNQGATTWYGFAQEIFRLTNTKITVKPVSTSEFPRPVVRPSYSVLDCSKISKLLNLSIPSWQNALSRCLKAMN